MPKKKWNGMCPAGKHGLDYQGQKCDLCAAPPPPPTREEIRARYVMYVTGERDRAKEGLDEWRTKLAALGKEDKSGQPESALILDKLAWGQGAVETSARYKVTDDICIALETGITLEDIRDQVVTKALSAARWGSRSTSVMDDLCMRAKTAALAKEAETLISWCKQKTLPDAAEAESDVWKRMEAYERQEMGPTFKK